MEFYSAESADFANIWLYFYVMQTSVGCEIDWRTDVHEQLQILTGYVQGIVQ